MISSSQLAPGMTISLNNELYLVESVTKVNISDKSSLIKAKLVCLFSQKSVEKNFKPNQSLDDVPLVQKNLEYLYPEGRQHLFLDINTLDQIKVPAKVIGDAVNFLKEGIQVMASFHNDQVLAIELPTYLEIMVSDIIESSEKKPVSDATKVAILETGAEVQVPLFIDVGDIIKIHTRTKEYVQRV